MLKRIIILLISCLMLIQPASAETDFKAVCTVTFQQTEARSMLSMINSFRTGSNAWYWNSSNSSKIYVTNLEKLVYDYDLEKIAMQRAAECALHYSHTRPNAESCFTAYDMVDTVYWTMGENIAAGYNAYETAGEVFAGWREDNEYYSGQGHRRNMLSASFNCIGIGHVVYAGCHFWAQALAYSEQPNRTSTAAQNTAVSVSVPVSQKLVSSLSLGSLSSSSLTLDYQETASIPRVSAQLRMSSCWPSSRGTSAVRIAPSWTSADPECVSVKGNKATGLSIGRTTLNGTLAGTAFKLPVTVRSAQMLKADFVLPESLSVIEYEAFSGLPVKSIVIQNGTSEIGDRAFADCISLQQVTIPDSVVSISSTAFENCPADILFYCTAGSTAAEYAQANGYPTIRLR